MKREYLILIIFTIIFEITFFPKSADDFNLSIMIRPASAAFSSVGKTIPVGRKCVAPMTGTDYYSTAPV